MHVDDQILGVQDLVGIDFLHTRQVRTASWLGLEFQGQGYGREMREAVLHLAFNELGATHALSGYLEDNVSSQKVSESLGYVATSVEEVEVRGRLVRHTKLVLERILSGKLSDETTSVSKVWTNVVSGLELVETREVLYDGRTIVRWRITLLRSTLVGW